MTHTSQGRKNIIVWRSRTNTGETPSMANSFAYRAMVTSTDKLINAILAGNPMAIADDLRTQELINPDVYQLMLLDTRITTDKARILVQAVTFQVQYKPKHFSNFLEVLRRNGLSDLVDMLENKCSKYCTQE